MAETLTVAQTIQREAIEDFGARARVIIDNGADWAHMMDAARKLARDIQRGEREAVRDALLKVGVL
jgi:hypothetical protein